MNEHPRDSLPAFVLGALNAAERSVIAAHLVNCAACRADMEAFRAIVEPSVAPSAVLEPPPHVKQQLFARIAAESRPRSATVTLPRRRRAAIAIGLLLVLTLVLATRIIQTHNRRDQAEQIRTFITAPETIAHRLNAPPKLPTASGWMYMQPGHNRAVLAVAGLRPPTQGRTYQWWFISPRKQVPSGTFTVGPDGRAELLLDIPEPVNTYTQVLVTLEASGGSKLPSSEVVLSAALGQQD